MSSTDRVNAFCASTHARVSALSAVSSHRYGSGTETPCRISTRGSRRVGGYRTLTAYATIIAGYEATSTPADVGVVRTRACHAVCAVTGGPAALLHGAAEGGVRRTPRQGVREDRRGRRRAAGGHRDHLVREVPAVEPVLLPHRGANAARHRRARRKGEEHDTLPAPDQRGHGALGRTAAGTWRERGATDRDRSRAAARRLRHLRADARGPNRLHHGPRRDGFDGDPRSRQRTRQSARGRSVGPAGIAGGILQDSARREGAGREVSAPLRHTPR